jgi:hypothetical protein
VTVCSRAHQAFAAQLEVAQAKQPNSAAIDSISPQPGSSACGITAKIINRAAYNT